MWVRSPRRGEALKRRLTKLVVFLLLGAIVNIAVAWGCALWPGVSFQESYSNSEAAATIEFRLESLGLCLFQYEAVSARVSLKSNR